MKTLLTNDNLSCYLFEDDEIVQINDYYITVGSPPKFIISDLNTNNSNMIENITAPVDWIGCKYYFIDGSWVLNEDYSIPRL